MSQQPEPNTFTSFLAWCQHYDQLSVEAKRTVLALRKVVAQSLSKTSDEVTCETADAFLSGLQELELGNYWPCHWLNPKERRRAITDLRPLQVLTQLKILIIRNFPVSDLSPLESLCNLETLSLSRLEVSNLSPLQSLIQLKSLSLYDLKANDLSPLRSLTQLTELRLSDIPVTNISSLKALTNLSSLTIEGDKELDLESLKYLPNLKTLYLSSFFGSKIRDLNWLEFLPNIEELQLSWAVSVADLTPLRDFHTLPKISYERDGGYISHGELLPYLHEEWLDLSAEKIDQRKAVEAVRLLYSCLNHTEPAVKFFDSPYAAMVWLQTPDVLKQCGQPVLWYEQIVQQMHDAITSWGTGSEWLYDSVYFREGGAIVDKIWGTICYTLGIDFCCYGRDIAFFVKPYRCSPIAPEAVINLINRAEFVQKPPHRVLSSETDVLLSVLYELFASCGWIFAFESVCIVCDRPTHFLAEPATSNAPNDCYRFNKLEVQFADDWGFIQGNC